MRCKEAYTTETSYFLSILQLSLANLLLIVNHGRLLYAVMSLSLLCYCFKSFLFLKTCLKYCLNTNNHYLTSIMENQK